MTATDTAIEPTVELVTREERRSTSTRGTGDLVVLAGAAAAAVSLTALLFDRIAPISGVLGFVVVSYLLFLVVYALLLSIQDSWLAVRDRLASVVVHSLALLALLALVFIVVFTFWRGRDALFHGNFFVTDMTAAGPLDPLTSGGILHAATGTLIEIVLALTVVIPLGLLCAVYLNETRGAFARFVRTIVEAMTALPSIVAGLFVYASLILGLGMNKSGLAAALAISVMMLPIVIRAADVVIRLVPSSLRESSLALGAGQWRTTWHVVLPTARSGLTTAILLGTARGIGETSPVLITAGFGSTLNLDPTEGPMVSLPLATFVFSGSPEPTMIARGFGAAAVLLAVVLVLFALARVLGGRPAGQLSARQRRRRDRLSVRDVARWEKRA
ncbi:phosphate ABC transporter permease PstA [Actinophytocola sp.]|uniref:phosphate ABC transporter permease PstA n=1 Tax=Actinophytocola sp. TaxID=1872138 RepID=UPI002ED1DE2A